MALPTNQAATYANTIIKNIETALEPTIENLIIAAVPALGLPVVKQLVGEIETVVENQIAKYLETGTDFLIYDVQTDGENGGAVSAYQNYLAALKTGDENAIATAKEALAKAEDALITDDGSASTQ